MKLCIYRKAPPESRPLSQAVQAASSCLANGSTMPAGIGSLSSRARAAPAGYGSTAQHRALHARYFAFPTAPAGAAHQPNTRPTKNLPPKTEAFLQPPQLHQMRRYLVAIMASSLYNKSIKTKQAARNTIDLDNAPAKLYEKVRYWQYKM